MTAAIWGRVSPSPWKTRKVYSMHNFDIPDVKWVERYVVGISHPEKSLTQEEIQQQLDLMNHALGLGKLVSVEQNFTIMSSGKKDIVTQYTVYHVGFKNRPPGK